MVARLYKFLTRSVKDIHKAAYVLALFALSSQVLALVRDRLFAHTFGASETLDIYTSAFRIPDLLYAAIASTVSLAVIIPFLTEQFSKGKKQAREFMESVITFFSTVMLVIIGVLFAFMPTIVANLFPGFEGEAASELIKLTRILLFQPFLLGLFNLFAAVAQVNKQFIVYSLGLLFYNVGIILGIIFLYPHYGISGLGYGVLLGALLQAAIQVPILVRDGIVPRRPRFSFETVKRVVGLSLPRTIALSGTQIVMLVLVSIMTIFQEGSVAIFNFAFNLQSVPLALIGVSYSVAAFPTLAELYTNGKRDVFAKQIATAARHIIFWSLPATALFIVLRAQIVRVILGTGEFGWSDTRLTAAVLALFVVSLVAQALSLLFIRGYYAAGKTFRPVAVSLVSSMIIIISAVVGIEVFNNSPALQDFLGRVLRISDLDGMQVIIPALAYSIGQIFQAIALATLFARDVKEYRYTLVKTLVTGIASSLILALVSYLSLDILDDIVDLTTGVGVFLQGIVAGIVGMIAAALFLIAIGNKEINTIIRTLRTKFWKGDVIAEEQI